MTDNKKAYITPQELADKLGTSAQMVRVCLRKSAPGWENIEFLACGNRLKISAASVEKWLKGE